MIINLSCLNKSQVFFVDFKYFELPVWLQFYTAEKNSLLGSVIHYKREKKHTHRLKYTYQLFNNLETFEIKYQDSVSGSLSAGWQY